MSGLRRAALIVIGVLVTAASAASFAESYRGLWLWAVHHGLSGIWGYGFPLQVDVFIAVGEAALFVALADGWQVRSRMGAWAVTLAGLAVSVAGNIGHITGTDPASRITAAVPPLAAAAALAVGLGVLKRTVQPELPPDPTTELAGLAGEVAAAMAALAAELRQPLDVPLVASWAAADGKQGRFGELPPGAARTRTRRRTRNASSRRTPSAPVTPRDAEHEFMSELAAGALPSQREIRSRMHVGQDRARALREHLEAVSARA